MAESSIDVWFWIVVSDVLELSLLEHQILERYIFVVESGGLEIIVGFIGLLTGFSISWNE